MVQGLLKKQVLLLYFSKLVLSSLYVPVALNSRNEGPSTIFNFVDKGLVISDFFLCLKSKAILIVMLPFQWVLKHLESKLGN